MQLTANKHYFLQLLVSSFTLYYAKKYKCLPHNTGQIVRLGASENDCTAREAEILPRCVVRNVMVTFMRRLMAA